MNQLPTCLFIKKNKQTDQKKKKNLAHVVYILNARMIIAIGHFLNIKIKWIKLLSSSLTVSHNKAQEYLEEYKNIQHPLGFIISGIQSKIF